ALVGCGRIAKRHAELLSGVVGGAQLVAVCDTDEARARSFGEKYGVAWFTDMDEMMAKASPDVVSVLTPSGMHKDHVVRLAPYGR
ncbi:Gfo/Idh/MocA family oxidoreductase, partial [Bacillus sp. SIMBA_154]